MWLRLLDLSKSNYPSDSKFWDIWPLLEKGTCNCLWLNICMYMETTAIILDPFMPTKFEVGTERPSTICVYNIIEWKKNKSCWLPICSYMYIFHCWLCWCLCNIVAIAKTYCKNDPILSDQYNNNSETCTKCTSNNIITWNKTYWHIAILKVTEVIPFLNHFQYFWKKQHTIICD